MEMEAASCSENLAHDITSQTTVIFISTVMRTLNLTPINLPPNTCFGYLLSTSFHQSVIVIYLLLTLLISGHHVISCVIISISVLLCTFIISYRDCFRPPKETGDCCD